MYYFNNFKRNNTIIYKIKDGKLIKVQIDKKKYYFKFDNESFSLVNFKEKITFKNNISFIIHK